MPENWGYSHFGGLAVEFALRDLKNVIIRWMTCPLKANAWSNAIDFSWESWWNYTLEAPPRPIMLASSFATLGFSATDSTRCMSKLVLRQRMPMNRKHEPAWCSSGQWYKMIKWSHLNFLKRREGLLKSGIQRDQNFESRERSNRRSCVWVVGLVQNIYQKSHSTSSKNSNALEIFW